MQRMPLTKAAEFLHIGTWVLEGILKYHVQKALDNIDLSNVRAIPLDETSCKRGHRYIAVIADADTKRIIFMIEGRGFDSLRQFSDWLIFENVCTISEMLGFNDSIEIEEPVQADKCGYDHFHNEKLFGGLVDGYIIKNGSRNAILEIKTAGSRELWEDDSGGYTNVPMQYMLQASLYAELSNLDKVVFLVGFLEEGDYTRPKQWVHDANNSHFIVKNKLDMQNHMNYCSEWCNEHLKQGFTPEWTEKDADVLKYLRAFKP